MTGDVSGVKPIGSLGNTELLNTTRGRKGGVGSWPASSGRIIPGAALGSFPHTDLAFGRVVPPGLTRVASKDRSGMAPPDGNKNLQDTIIEDLNNGRQANGEEREAIGKRLAGIATKAIDPVIASETNRTPAPISALNREQYVRDANLAARAAIMVAIDDKTTGYSDDVRKFVNSLPAGDALSFGVALGINADISDRQLYRDHRLGDDGLQLGILDAMINTTDKTPAEEQFIAGLKQGISMKMID